MSGNPRYPTISDNMSEMHCPIPMITDKVSEITFISDDVPGTVLRCLPRNALSEAAHVSALEIDRRKSEIV